MNIQKYSGIGRKMIDEWKTYFESIEVKAMKT